MLKRAVRMLRAHYSMLPRHDTRTDKIVGRRVHATWYHIARMMHHAPMQSGRDPPKSYRRPGLPAGGHEMRCPSLRTDPQATRGVRIVLRLPRKGLLEQRRRAQNGPTSHRHYHFRHTMYSLRYELSHFLVDELQAIW